MPPGTTCFQVRILPKPPQAIYKTTAFNQWLQFLPTKKLLRACHPKHLAFKIRNLPKQPQQDVKLMFRKTRCHFWLTKKPLRACHPEHLAFKVKTRPTQSPTICKINVLKNYTTFLATRRSPCGHATRNTLLSIIRGLLFENTKRSVVHCWFMLIGFLRKTLQKQQNSIYQK